MSQYSILSIISFITEARNHGVNAMHTRLLILLVALMAVVLAGPVPMAAQQFGKFKGTVQVEWQGGRLMVLLQPFGYVDPDGIEWTAPKGLATDGASIPRILWSIIGGPFDGPYRAAAVIHDLYCITQSRPHAQVHKAFHHASLAAGESTARAWLMYKAIERWGPKWTKVKPRDVRCDRFDSVSQVNCTANSSELDGLARQPNQDEIEAFLSEMGSEGYADDENLEAKAASIQTIGRARRCPFKQSAVRAAYWVGSRQHL